MKVLMINKFLYPNGGSETYIFKLGEYLEKMGYGNQPYLVFKHEDINRYHLHIVTVRVDEDGRSIDTRNNFYRSKQITRELERKGTVLPALRALARGTSFPTGKLRSSRIFSISRPTAPVAPRTATV